MTKVLIIDDDREVVDLNRQFLKERGYSVKGICNPVEALKFLKENPADIVLLDVMMPGMDGYDVCSRIREFSDVPVIFLTGRDGEEDRINGFTLGADDYILKPYSLKELELRIEAILKRTKKPMAPPKVKKPPTKSHIASFGKLSIDRVAHRVFFDGQEVIFSNKEYEAFSYMTENPDRTVTFNELGVRLFGDDRTVEKNDVMVVVCRMRKKMNFSAEFSEMIESVWAKGYKFISGKGAF